MIADETTDVVVARAKSQHDNGVAAGAPPLFDGASYGAKPRPAGESSGGGVSMLPRLGGGDPILVDAVPRAPAAPWGGGIAPYAPKAPDDAPPVLVAPVAPGRPILQAAPGQATTPTQAAAPGERVVLSWRMAVLATTVVVFFFFLMREER